MSTQTSLTTTISPQFGVTIEVTEYDPESGGALRPLKSLNFDKTSPGKFSTPVVIKMNVKGVQKISDIRLGITKSSLDLTSSGEENEDGTSATGNFGIEHSSALVEKSDLTTFFSGINTSSSQANENNVLIDNSTLTESEYVYLNVQMPSSTARGYIGYKWFFDFS